MSSSRIAFVLLCGIAVCCSVMYISADGDEIIHEIVKSDSAKDVDAGTSVSSTDVLKAGQIYSETPDGRMRLMDYFNNVEKEISNEVQNRKSDITSVRAQMARDFAFNAASRAKLKRNMLHKMALNAKLARDHLNHAMRRCQERFAKQARLANRRNKSDLRRSKKMTDFSEHDKREAARNLKLSVSAWQKTTNAWAAATNARITRANKSVAANAAQIKENAKKARKDLDSMTASWDNKVATFKTSSKNARTKLGMQFAAQDKATRAWANNKIKGLVAETSAQFNDVETKMATNRQEVDMRLRQATMRLEAAMIAVKALEDQHYAKTVANIEVAKKEAKSKVEAAESEFKVALLSLGSTVAEQVQGVNNRIDATGDVVRSNAAAQAKVNANVNAEMTRMIKLGNTNYKKHLKDDVELQRLIGKNKAENDSKLNKMALNFNTDLSTVRKTLAKERKHAEDTLKKETAGLYTKMFKMTTAQEKKNVAMEAETRRARLDAMDAIRKAKQDFQKKITNLGKVVATNDKAADAKIKELTGVVTENAMKSAQGRQELADLEEANKLELKKAIKGAIATGEKRAQQVEEHGAKMDKDTKFLINNKLNSEISKLQAETDASVEKLSLMNKEARDAMKKEMVYAVHAAVKLAKDDLAIAVKDGEEKMVTFEKKAAKVHMDSSLARGELSEEVNANAKEISRMIKDAMATDAAAQAALASETSTSIKKTNKRVDAYSTQMAENAKKVRAEIKAETTKQLGMIKTEQQRARDAVENFSSDDAARQESALKFLDAQIKLAEKEADQKFGKASKTLAADRKHADEALAAAYKGLNDELAEQAALADSRFEKSVKDISAARKNAADDVKTMRKEFSTQMVLVKSTLKNIQQGLVDNIAKVSGEVISLKANQVRVNTRTDAELKRIEGLANSRFSESKRARGKLRQLMDENKAAAAAEVKELATELNTKITNARSKNAAHKREYAKDLTEATQKFYEKLSAEQKLNIEASETLDTATQAAKVISSNNLAAARKEFKTKTVALTNLVLANEEAAASGMAKITGVVHDYAKASAKDRNLVKDETKALEKDLNKAVARAISIGEAKAKAVEQRVAKHLKNTKRFLQVELNESVERAADSVYKLLEGNRQKIADNYLSLKAYAISATDEIQDAVEKGQGKALSSVGDLLITVGALGPVRAKPADGAGMGGTAIPTIFSGENIKVSGAVAAINGLNNEFAESMSQVRNRWPMGLGKYLLTKVQGSMESKGVLQVDKVEGKSGNFVFMNGRSVGLSNKMNLFSTIAAQMKIYEYVLAKLTSKLSAPRKEGTSFVKAPEWKGD